jgi:hypothetical protein
LYNTVFIDGIRFGNEDGSQQNKTHDGCLLYRKSNSTGILVGFLRCIFDSPTTKNCFFIIEKISILSDADELEIDDQKFRCTNVMFGKVKKPTCYHMIRPSNVLEKLAFRPYSLQSSNLRFDYVFFRYPNFRTST